MNRLNWKRIYEKPGDTDGFRIFVDRLWARGVKKDEAKIDYWAKNITPTTEIRQDYHKGKIDFETFSKKYLSELKENPEFDEFVGIVREKLEDENVTILFASKNPELSHIPTLRKYLEEKLKNK